MISHTFVFHFQKTLDESTMSSIYELQLDYFPINHLYLTEVWICLFGGEGWHGEGFIIAAPFSVCLEHQAFDISPGVNNYRLTLFELLVEKGAGCARIVE